MDAKAWKSSKLFYQKSHWNPSLASEIQIFSKKEETCEYSGLPTVTSYKDIQEKINEIKEKLQKREPDEKYQDYGCYNNIQNAQIN